jgi:hypothetical protein
VWPMSSMTWVVISGAVPCATALVGLLRYRMRLAFLRHIYDHHGDRLDLEAAGRALAPVWLALHDRQPASAAVVDAPSMPLRSVPDPDDESFTS